MPQRRLSIIGSTGSIGNQSLEAAEQTGAEVVCLCANSNTEILSAQANKYKPKYVGILCESVIDDLKEKLTYRPIIIAGRDALKICASLDEIDTVINAPSGIVGLDSLIAAINSGKRIGAANKESIVCAHEVLEGYKQKPNGALTKQLKNGAELIPVDSEQSAIFQCIDEIDENNIKSLILTASGGAFRDYTADMLENVTVEDALKHPTWAMGKKITIDSATMFNKGLEVMEAAYLFGLGADEVEVVIHPQSIVHSMVRFKDESVKAQMALPDMRLAIQYAITYPNRIKSQTGRLDFSSLNMTFYSPDRVKYPALDLAYEALKCGGAMPAVYNGANEAAVALFTEGKTKFTEISKRVEYAMSKTDKLTSAKTLEEIMNADREARRYAMEWRAKP